MVSTIDHIRNILSDNRPEDALVEMQGWMSPGDEGLMKALIAMKRRQGNRSLSGELGKFLDQIERESPRLTSFLGHYHAANKAYKDKNWKEARVHLEEAIELHQSEYLALRPDLTSKLERIEHQEAMDDLIGQANARYEEGEWEKALSLFKEARSHYFPGCDWKMDNFEGGIQLCKNGIAYEQHVAAATAFQQQGKWTQAISELQQARRYFHPDCKPDLTVLEEEIRWSEQQAAMDTREIVLDRPVVVMMRKYLLPVLFTLTIGALAWLFIKYPEWTANEDIATAAVSAEASTSESPGRLSSSADGSFEAESSEQPAAGSEDVVVNSLPEDLLPEEYPLSTEEIESLPLPPVPQSTIEGEFEPGKTIRIELSNYDPAFQYEIDFGDGTRSEGSKVMTHVYDEPGTYQVSMKAANSLGGGNAVTRTVVISEAESESSSESPDIALSPITNPTPVAEPAVSQTNDSAVELPVSRPVAPRDFADVMPQFPGGSAALRAYLDSETRYPEQARENELEGKVYIQFVVGTDGSLSEIRLARGIGFGCDEEALRLVRSMPRWVPGSHQGTVQPVRYTLPITFVLK